MKDTHHDSAPRPGWLSLADALVDKHVPGTERWHYEQGLALWALENIAEVYNKSRFQGFVQRYLEALVDPQGLVRSYRPEDFSLDQINPGKVVQSLAARSPDPRWQACLRSLRDQLSRQPRTASGGFWHKKIYPGQMWLDGLYMQAPFLARWGREQGNPEDLAEAVAQLGLMEEKSRDPETGLLYHAWDDRGQQLWANPETGCSPHFWSRALGWYSMALVDVLEWLPPGSPGIVKVQGILTRLAPALVRYQAPSGFWFQVVDQGQRPGNYLETSGTAMVAYTLYKGIRRGWLDDPTGSLKAAADRAWGALGTRFRVDSAGAAHLDGICQVAGLGGSPYRDGSFRYYVGEPVVSDDLKGIGPFLLAGLEREYSQ